EGRLQQDAYARRGQECAGGERRLGAGGYRVEGAAGEGHSRLRWRDVRERIDRARSDRRFQHPCEPGRDRARDADFQGPQGAALDRFDGVSQWGCDLYVSAGEIRRYGRSMLRPYYTIAIRIAPSLQANHGRMSSPC